LVFSAAPVVASLKAATGAMLFRGSLLDARGLFLRDQAKLRGFEGVVLGHRFVRTVQAIQDQLAKVRKPYLPVHWDMLLTLVVDQINLIAFLIASDLNVLA
jgi:hypothetical protein